MTATGIFCRSFLAVLPFFLLTGSLVVYSNKAQNLLAPRPFPQDRRPSASLPVTQRTLQPARTIDLDLPATFHVVKNASFARKFTVSHAVLVESERAVVFVVVTKPRDSSPPTKISTVREEVFEMSEEVQCVFNRPGWKEKRTRLRMFRTGEMHYSSSTVWKCALPEGEVGTFQSVRIAGLQKAEGAGGEGGVWRIGARAKVPKVSLISCVNLYGVESGSAMYSKVQQYVRHYRALGVEHFVFYTFQGDAGADLLGMFHNVTTVRMTPTLQKTGLHEEKYAGQKVAATDCMWRARGRARWAMNMVDLDEFAVGVPSLKEEVESVGKGFSAVVMKHRLVERPFGDVLVREGIRMSTKGYPIWGKSIVRPEEVDVMWVHAATAWAGGGDGKGKEHTMERVHLLHFRSMHHDRYQTNDTTKWQFEKVDLSMIPREAFEGGEL